MSTHEKCMHTIRRETAPLELRGNVFDYLWFELDPQGFEASISTSQSAPGSRGPSSPFAAARASASTRSAGSASAAAAADATKAGTSEMKLPGYLSPRSILTKNVLKKRHKTRSWVRFKNGSGKIWRPNGACVLEI